MKSSHQHNAVNSHLNARHFNGPIEDRLAIRELLDSYSDAVIRRDQILWSSCWAMNASWHLGSQIIVGRDAILSHWIDMKANSRGIKGSYTRAFFNFPGAPVHPEIQGKIEHRRGRSRLQNGGSWETNLEPLLFIARACCRLSITDGSLSKAAIAAIRTYVITCANEDKALELSRKIARC
jgi:hypothetical protein